MSFKEQKSRVGLGVETQGHYPVVYLCLGTFFVREALLAHALGLFTQDLTSVLSWLWVCGEENVLGRIWGPPSWTGGGMAHGSVFSSLPLFYLFLSSQARMLSEMGGFPSLVLS